MNDSTNNSKIETMLSKLKSKGFKSTRHEANFFEVAGYPHYENVVSNILKFLFDTREEHEFGDLWLKSLLQVYNSKNPENFVDIEGITVSNIEREYSNGDEKRIDLLVDCDSFLVVIENKIYAGLYNDLNKYTSMAKRYKKEKVPIVKIVLSLKPEQSSIDKKTGYINITYDELINQVEINNNTEITNKWSLFNKEFIDNLKYRRGADNMKLDETWLHFAEENVNEIKKIIEAKNQDRKTRLDILRAINSETEKETIINDLHHGVYNYSNETYVSQYIDIPLDDNNKTLCVETYIMTEPPSEKSQNPDYEKYSYLYISLWCRRDKNYKGFDEVLNEIGRPNETRKIQSRGWGYHYILDEIDLLEEIDITGIATKIVEYVKKISDLLKK